MHDIKYSITLNEVKKIFGSKKNAVWFLNYYESTLSKTIAQNKNKLSSEEIYKLIVDNWDYDEAKTIIRNLFRETKKYTNGKEAASAIDALIQEWKELNLGKIEWPCSQGAFDAFVQKVNSSEYSRSEKDSQVRKAAVKYRRLKELNTYRNDYIEALVFDKNDSIIPTLNHKKGVDFYINGIAFDQKVSRSPTTEFKKDFGDNWKEVAKENPAQVAKYLYKYQDEGRFGADPRLYIVYLDEEIPVIELNEKIKQIDVDNPLLIEFEYKHASLGKKFYKTYCFIILLSK